MRKTRLKMASGVSIGGAIPIAGAAFEPKSPRSKGNCMGPPGGCIRNECNIVTGAYVFRRSGGQSLQFPMNIVKPKISALGSYLPTAVLTNADLEKMVNTNDEWIVSRTGIRERHVAAPEQATSDLAVEAAKDALAHRGLAASELDAIIVCTVTPDMLFPGTACLVQHKIGASKAWGFDLIAACSGFLDALTTGAKLVRSGRHKYD